jgi:hypothetical protein
MSNNAKHTPWSLAKDGSICVNGRVLAPEYVVEALNNYDSDKSELLSAPPSPRRCPSELLPSSTKRPWRRRLNLLRQR